MQEKFSLILFVSIFAVNTSFFFFSHGFLFVCLFGFNSIPCDTVSVRYSAFTLKSTKQLFSAPKLLLSTSRGLIWSYRV